MATCVDISAIVKERDIVRDPSALNSSLDIHSAEFSVPDRSAKVGISTRSDQQAKPQVTMAGVAVLTVPLPASAARNVESEVLCCKPMSAVRRLFCLIATFDVILSLVLWVIYVKEEGKDWRPDLINHNLNSALFDILLCSAVRSVCLLIGYAFLRFATPWCVAVTTSSTCVYLVIKACLFDWSNHPNPIIIYIFLASFIMAWVEALLLDFKVLPHEQRLLQQQGGIVANVASNERTPLLAPHIGRENHLAPMPQVARNIDDMSPIDDNYHSFTPSDDESDNELPQYSTRIRRTQSCSSLQSCVMADEVMDYKEKAKESWHKTWMFAHSDDWKHETGRNLSEGIVYWKHVPMMGKLFKLEALVECSPQQLFHQLVINVADTPKWNKTIAECRILDVIDDCTDICYNVTASRLVSSRDFVNLRHWRRLDDVILTSGCAVVSLRAPPCDAHIRGENRAGCGMMFRSVAEKPNQCLFTWILNTNIKGWIPQIAVDQALSNMLLEFFRHLKLHVEGQRHSVT